MKAQNFIAWTRLTDYLKKYWLLSSSPSVIIDSTAIGKN
jgi:hypothetical protein